LQVLFSNAAFLTTYVNLLPVLYA